MSIIDPDYAAVIETPDETAEAELQETLELADRVTGRQDDPLCHGIYNPDKRLVGIEVGRVNQPVMVCTIREFRRLIMLTGPAVLSGQPHDDLDALG